MDKRNRGILQHWTDAIRWSLQGLSAAWRNESAFRQEILTLLILLPVAIWLGTTALHRAALIGSLLLIVIVELVNSAIEAVVDRIGPECHPLSGRAKNLGSAAVFCALLCTALIWGLIAWERWF